VLALAAAVVALVLLARRSPVAALLCVAAVGWALSTERLHPPRALQGPLQAVRTVWVGAQAATEARIRCDVLTRRALAAGPSELEAAVAAAERACPSAGDPLEGD
jgi:hypothetical protein